MSLAWVASWDCEGQVGLNWRQSSWWNGVSPAVGHSLQWWWSHTTLEYHSGTKGVWTLRRICCDCDLIVGRSCMRKRLKQQLSSESTIVEQFLTLTSHCSISAMMTVDCPHSTRTTLCNVWLSTSGTTEVAKNWTTAFTKVGTSQKCSSCRLI